MTVRYRTEGVNHHGDEGWAYVPGGIRVPLSSPLTEPQEGAGTGTNPEQLLALAWSTCLNATAQVVLEGKQRSSVRVAVELRSAARRPGYEFHLDAYLAVEGAAEQEAAEVLAAAHSRCPVSRLLHGATTVATHTEPYPPPE